MRHLTIRNVPPMLARSLEIEKERSGRSLNGTVIALLSRALGVDHLEPGSNGLRRLAGTWTDEEARAMDEALAIFEQIDEKDDEASP